VIKKINSIGMFLVYVPAGKFLMGNPSLSDTPVHRVEVSGFWIGQYEVTNAQFDRFQKRTRPPESLTDGQPVMSVPWPAAERFCTWLSRKEDRRYRLPTEAEWEYAARGGLEQQDFPWGNESPQGRATVGVLATTPVGRYEPNGFGLYDMAGNVNEWVSDWYGENYYRHSPAKDPTGPATPTVNAKVTRGGSFGGWEVSCWLRVAYAPVSAVGYTGFRVVVDSHSETKASSIQTLTAQKR